MDLRLNEAQLLRHLMSFFGAERVVVNMSVLAVCGGELPAAISNRMPQLGNWAKRNHCLFTIVNSEDEPRMVVEFRSDHDGAIDALETEHQAYLSPILHEAKIRYITFSQDEFVEVLQPDGRYDFFTLLRSKVGVPLEGEGVS